jgi:uncharacterized membrane-anchored protein
MCCCGHIGLLLLLELLASHKELKVFTKVLLSVRFKNKVIMVSCEQYFVYKERKNNIWDQARFVVK